MRFRMACVRLRSGRFCVRISIRERGCNAIEDMEVEDIADLEGAAKVKTLLESLPPER